MRHHGPRQGTLNSSRGTVREMVHASSRIVRLAAGSCYVVRATIGAAFPPPSHLPARCPFSPFLIPPAVRGCSVVYHRLLSRHRGSIGNHLHRRSFSFLRCTSTPLPSSERPVSPVTSETRAPLIETQSTRGFSAPRPWLLWSYPLQHQAPAATPLSSSVLSSPL